MVYVKAPGPESVPEEPPACLQSCLGLFWSLHYLGREKNKSQVKRS